MGLLDPKALRDWIKSRAVNNLMATVKGFFLDARLGPVIQGKIDEVKTEVEEINGNLLWKQAGECAIGNSIDISPFINVAREFMCLFAFGRFRATVSIPNFYLESTGSYYYGGGSNGTDNIYAVCNFTDTSATFVAFSKGIQDLSGGVMIVYYR